MNRGGLFPVHGMIMRLHTRSDEPLRGTSSTGRAIPHAAPGTRLLFDEVVPRWPIICHAKGRRRAVVSGSRESADTASEYGTNTPIICVEQQREGVRVRSWRHAIVAPRLGCCFSRVTREATDLGGQPNIWKGTQSIEFKDKIIKKANSGSPVWGRLMQ